MSSREIYRPVRKKSASSEPHSSNAVRRSRLTSTQPLFNPIEWSLTSRVHSPTMFDTVCTLPLSSDLFTQAIHPSQPVVSVGLATGHVQTFRLPSEEHDGEDDATSNSSACKGKGHIDTMWRTRRHKGSCRCLGFGHDGEMLYSAGTDGLVKAARSETGQVENKIAIPFGKDGYAICLMVYAGFLCVLCLCQ